MEANELRIGNYVDLIGLDYVMDNPVADYNSRETVVVDSSVLKNILDFNGTTDYDLYEPIPLTEEWLLRFGFEKIIVENYPLYVYDGFMIEIYTDNCVVCYNNTEIPKIKFVHSLQNLYFSIKLKELLCDNI